MEYVGAIIIILVVIIFYLSKYILLIVTYVYKEKNNNFVQDYIKTAMLINPKHFITTVNDGESEGEANVIIADDGIHFPAPNLKSLKLPIDAIEYYVKDGDVHYTSHIPLSGPKKLQNVTAFYDNIETYIYYRVKDIGVAVLSIKGREFYQNLKLRFPYKEYEYVKNCKNKY